MDTLPGIETVMTNFNQIVTPKPVVQSYLFCFDLPVSQLQSDPSISDITPLSPSSRGSVITSLDQLSMFGGSSDIITEEEYSHVN